VANSNAVKDRTSMTMTNPKTVRQPGTEGVWKIEVSGSCKFSAAEPDLENHRESKTLEMAVTEITTNIAHSAGSSV